MSMWFIKTEHLSNEEVMEMLEYLESRGYLWCNEDKPTEIEDAPLPWLYLGCDFVTTNYTDVVAQEAWGLSCWTINDDWYTKVYKPKALQKLIDYGVQELSYAEVMAL